MKLKKALVMILVLAMVLSITACATDQAMTSATTSSAESSSAEMTTTGTTIDTKSDNEMSYDDDITRQDIQIKVKADGEPIKIGFAGVMNTMMTYLFDAITAYDEANDDVSITLVDTKGDISLEASAVENFISMGCDAIILLPTDSTAGDQASLKCNEAGIPIVCVNSGMKAPQWTMVGSAQYYAGQLQGEWLAENTDGTGNYCIVLGDLSNEASYARTQGLKDVLAEKCPDMVELAEDDCGWMRDTALAITENWLQSDFAADIDYIVSNNDEGAIGAALACQAAGRDEIKILGVDAGSEGLAYMDSGMLDFTVFQNVTAQGTAACETCVKIIHGEDVPKYVDIPMEPVTMDNYNSYLNS